MNKLEEDVRSGNIDSLIAYGDNAAVLVEIAEHGSAGLMESFYKDSMDINLKDERGNTPIMLSIIRNYPDMIIAISSRGAKLDVENEHHDTPLVLALKHSTVEMASLICEFGANVDHQNEKGTTALIALCLTREYQAVEFLLKSGSDIGIKNNNSLDAVAATILQKYDSSTIMEMLIEKGADITSNILISDEAISPLELSMKKKKYNTHQVILKAIEG